MKFRRLKVFCISFLLGIFLKKINVIAMENVENFIDQIGKTNNYDLVKMIDYCEEMLNKKSTQKNDKLQAKIYFSLVYLNRLELNYNGLKDYIYMLSEYYKTLNSYIINLKKITEINYTITANESLFEGI